LTDGWVNSAADPRVSSPAEGVGQFRCRPGSVGVPDNIQLGPRQLGAPEKFALLLEAAGLKEDERGPWIREKGLHTEHLQLWQQELRDTVAEKSNKDKQDLKDAKKRIKELEKELNRKDKALAEMAALVALKKKLHHILEDSEDD
jgi:transposase